MGFTKFYRVLPSFTEFYRVLPSFELLSRALGRAFIGFYRVLPSFFRSTVFLLEPSLTWGLPSCTEFPFRSERRWIGFTEFYRVFNSQAELWRGSLSGFTEFYRVFSFFFFFSVWIFSYLKSTEFYRVSYSVRAPLNGFYRVLPSFSH